MSLSGSGFRSHPTFTHSLTLLVYHSPGRLELHIEVSLPDEEGRLQILNIHTAAMRNSKRMADR